MLSMSGGGASEDGTGWVDLLDSPGWQLDADMTFGCHASIHWGASVALDPHREGWAYVSSGNGIWVTRDLDGIKKDRPGPREWRFFVRGLEESVPMDLVSIPEGPIVSAIWDYAGFTQDRPDVYSVHGQFRQAPGLNIRLASVGRGANARVLRLNAQGQMAWSVDSGVHWQELEKHGLAKAGATGGLALSSDGRVILYSGTDRKVYRNDEAMKHWPAAGWSEVKSLEGAALPAADALDPARFYSYRASTGEWLESRDGGRNFVVSLNVGRGGNPAIRAVPGRTGDLWLAMGTGGLRRVVGGRVMNVAFHRGLSVGFGRGRRAWDYPAVYVWGQPRQQDPEGAYRSEDEGRSWLRVNDDRHQYGGLGNGGFIKGDMNVFGRVYISTAGRGVAYGVPQKR